MHCALLLALAIAAPPEAVVNLDAGPSDRSVSIPHALVSPVQEARIPALRPGRLIAFDVAEGDEIAEGQSLARFDAEEAEAKAHAARESHGAALLEAGSDLKIQASEHATRLAELHRRLTAKVIEELPRAITAVEREQTVVRHEQAILQTALDHEAAALAGHQAAMRGAELRLAEIDLAERSLSAPFAGVVVERFAKEHEWIPQGEPVLHLVKMETLQVEAFLDMAEAAPADIDGRPARLAVTVGPNRLDVFEGKVAFVSPILEADGAYRVRVEVENRRDRKAWLLRPGMVGELEILVASDQAVESGSFASQDEAATGPIEAESTDLHEAGDDASSPRPTPTETSRLDSPEAARLELAIDDEIVTVLASEDSPDAEEPSEDASVGEAEADDDASR